MKRFDFNANFEYIMQEHHLDTVVILAHMNPDGDAAGCVLGLAHYIRVVYPEYRVLPYLADTLDRGAKKLVFDDVVFDPFVLPEAERYAVIVCDTATKERMIGLEIYEKAVASIVMDHHASNQGYGDVNETMISEACSENIFYYLDWKRWKLAINIVQDTDMENRMENACDANIIKVDENTCDHHPNAADYFYLGIMHDTGGFVRAKESTMRAAASLISLGVVHQYVMKTMQNETLASLQKRSMLLNLAKRAVNGQVAYVCIDRNQRDELGIAYENIHEISGFLRDCEDLQMGFTMYEEEDDVWRCSFRSDGKWINVNEMLTPFGGGGHAAAAGLRKKTEDSEKLLADILERISEMTGVKKDCYLIGNSDFTM